jgi:hypothetical protein
MLLIILQDKKNVVLLRPSLQIHNNKEQYDGTIPFDYMQQQREKCNQKE